MDDELRALLGQLLTKVEAIDLKVDGLDAKVGEMGVQMGELGAKVDGLAEEIEVLKHTSAVQHYKAVGRIEQVASMLAEHMVEHHQPSPDRRTA